MLSSSIRNVSKVAARSQNSVQVRTFFGLFGSNTDLKRTMPTNEEQAWGREKLELDAIARGDVAFSREPIIPPVDAGTKENPIMVPSGLEKRTVGFEHPYTHQLVWFNLAKGPLHFVPQTGLYFKMYNNNIEDIHGNPLPGLDAAHKAPAHH